jgi:hypothetical protein
MLLNYSARVLCIQFGDHVGLIPYRRLEQTAILNQNRDDTLGDFIQSTRALQYCRKIEFIPVKCQLTNLIAVISGYGVSSFRRPR